MKNLIHKNQRPYVIVSPFIIISLVFNCATTPPSKKMLEKLESVKLLKAEQNISMQLKRECIAVAMVSISDSSSQSTKNIREYAVKIGTDTGQILKEKNSTWGVRRYVRFWQCSKEIKKIDLVNSAVSPKNAFVSIVPFVNNTNDINYNWMSTSLADAVDKSMEKRFKFEKSNKTPENSINKNNVSDYAEKSSSDIVIFGKYTFEEGKESISIQTQIYYKSQNKIVDEVSESAPVDSSLFTSTDKMAEKITQTIYKYEVQTKYNAN